MEPRFHAVQAAIAGDDVAGLTRLLEGDPALATATSALSHPTLMQCAVLATPFPAGLERGADPGIRDRKVKALPEDWAAHEGHEALARRLRAAREGRAYSTE